MAALENIDGWSGSKAAVERPLFATLLVLPNDEVRRSKHVDQARVRSRNEYEVFSTTYEVPRTSYKVPSTLYEVRVLRRCSKRGVQQPSARCWVRGFDGRDRSVRAVELASAASSS